MQAARCGIGERFHRRPLDAARAREWLRFYFGSKGGHLDRWLLGLPARADAANLNARRRFASASAPARLVAVAFAGLVVEVAAAGVKPAAVSERWSRHRSRQHQRDRWRPGASVGGPYYERLTAPPHSSLGTRRSRSRSWRCFRFGLWSWSIQRTSARLDATFTGVLNRSASRASFHCSSKLNHGSALKMSA